MKIADKASATSAVATIKQKFTSRHPFVVPILTLSFLLVLTLVGFIIFGGQIVKPADSKVVRLYIDGKNQIIPTRAATVRDMLNRSNVPFSEKDLIEPSLDSPISSQEFSVNIYRAKPVVVIDESGARAETQTAETAPASMAKQAGYDLYPEDKITIVDPDTSLKSGVLTTQVKIDRATPVKVNLYGTTYDVRTHAETVADLAKERNITYDEKSILPISSTRLKPNDVVFITQPGKQIASAEELIPNGEEVINDQGLPAGTTQVRSEGAPGRKAVVYEITANGKKKPLQEVIISQPVKRVVVKGKKSTAPNTSVGADKAALMSQAGISGEQQSSADYIISRESGWRPAARSASNCIGLGQKCNAASLISACPNWETDPVCQLRHFNSYAVGRYGSWNQAYSFWQVNHWW